MSDPKNEMVTLFEGAPLFTYVVDEADQVSCVQGPKRVPVRFDDPEAYALDDYADPGTPVGVQLRFQYLVTQQLRKRIEAKHGSKVSHLIYKRRVGKTPLVAIIVADVELTFEVIKKVDGNVTGRRIGKGD